ncbi:hypothetical protein V8E36_003486 [Tilletia maclaganii]
MVVGVVQEVRWCYAGKGRSAYAFCNGESGTAFPEQWETEAAPPSTVKLKDTTRSNMMRKIAVEDGRSYSCNVFMNTRMPRSWTMHTSLPCVSHEAAKDLRAALTAITNRVKLRLLRQSEELTRVVVMQSAMGGRSRSKLSGRGEHVVQGDEMEPGRISTRGDNHDLTTINEAHRLRSNAVPEATMLDVAERDIYSIDWHVGMLACCARATWRLGSLGGYTRAARQVGWASRWYSSPWSRTDRATFPQLFPSTTEAHQELLWFGRHISAQEGRGRDRGGAVMSAHTDTQKQVSFKVVGGVDAELPYLLRISAATPPPFPGT